jgi:hypothetical protein
MAGNSWPLSALAGWAWLIGLICGLLASFAGCDMWLSHHIKAMRWPWLAVGLLLAGLSESAKNWRFRLHYSDLIFGYFRPICAFFGHYLTLLSQIASERPKAHYI